VSDPGLFARADRILEAALDLDPSERAAFVARETAGDTELRGLVSRLLGHLDCDDPRLEPGAALDGTLAAGAIESAVAAPTVRGERIGRYRLVGELGRGGMSVVFLAERADGGFRQQVALKLIQERFPGPAAVARFERERQILADARHPDIARLLDGGETDDGRPYLVMELVDGEPIDAWCDRRRLDVRARLRLFLRVARAVEHAHRRLVVHRDIKPSNTLVTGDGDVKLLDFGIAKLVDEAAGESPGALTATHERLMTPAYASPEQVRGEPVTTATDVYQLGVLLYLLLTGRWPYRETPGSGAAAMMAICRQPATRPSATATGRSASPSPGRDDAMSPRELAGLRGTTPARLRRELAGDLDLVVLTALRKEPERRYGSVSRLIEDVVAVLEHRPVSARPDSVAYRASRFLRRHAAASLVAGVAILSVSAVAGWHFAEVARERDRARLEAAKATETARFLRGLFEVAGPTRSRGETVTARELLERGAGRVERELAGQPVLQAELLTVIGEVYLDLGLYDEATAALGRAVDIRRREPGEDGLDLAASLHGLGRVAHLTRDAGTGRMALEECLAIRRTAFGEDHPEVARAEDSLGLVLVGEGELDRARELQEHAVAVLERSLGADHPDLGEVLNHLATTVVDQRDHAGAVPLYRRALEIFEARWGGDHPNTARTTVNLAGALRFAGDAEEADRMYRTALDRIEAVYGDDHPNVAVVLNNHANLLKDRGRFEESVRLHRQAMAIWSGSFGPDHAQVGWSLNNLGLVAREMGDHRQAERDFARSVEVIERHFGPDHHELATPLKNLAEERLELGDPAGALELLGRVLAIRERVYGPDHSYLSEVLTETGRSLAALGRPGEAEPALRRAIAVGRPDPDHRGPEVTRPTLVLAEVLVQAGRTEEARALLAGELELAPAEARSQVVAALDRVDGRRAGVHPRNAEVPPAGAVPGRGSGP